LSTRKKIWFNYWQDQYKKNEPAFYNPSGFKWAGEIETQWPLIEKELSVLIKNKEQQFQTYFGSGRDTGSTGWKTITLKTWGIEVKENLNQCPVLKKLIYNTPGWISAAISLLEPETSIKKHQGDTDAIYRAHVGIKIPDVLPECGLKVNNIEQSWSEGKVVIFLDAHWHEAWNLTSEKRMIMIIDVVKDEFLEQKENICIHVRSFLLLQVLGIKFPKLMKFPKLFHRIIFFIIFILLKMAHPFQKKYGVILKHN